MAAEHHLATGAESGGELAAHELPQRRLRADDPRGDLAPPGAEVTGGDQPVPAVVATSGHNGDRRGAVREHPPGAPRHLPAGDLHELDGVDAGGRGSPIEVGDVVRGQRSEAQPQRPGHGATEKRTASPRAGPRLSTARALAAAISMCPALPATSASPASISA